MMTATGILAVIILLLLAWLTVTRSLLIPPAKGLPVLMYHNISDGKADGLHIPAEMLERQLAYLHEKNYTAISFGELYEYAGSGKPLPERPVILTFDDAYEGFILHAVLLLLKYNFRASVFIPVAYLGGTNEWDKGPERILSPGQVKRLAESGLIEAGLHSYRHRSYGEMSPEEMKQDLDDCIKTLESHNIPFVRVLAYPYGSFPKKDPVRQQQMKDIFRDAGITFALRIGNRVNPIPLRDPYLLKRIDIRGTDSFSTFRIKLKKGRKKLFS
jgi:peptidoglycan/xylan/chitin deacetylase (PgdA/CDA1 family)